MALKFLPEELSQDREALERFQREARAASTLNHPNICSPEQARGEKLDARSDLFSFGAVLYEMATSKQAFAGNTSAVIFSAILNQAPVSAVLLNPKLPEGVERIINRLLEKDHDLRTQSAADLRSDLKRLRRDTESEQSVCADGHSVVFESDRLGQYNLWKADLATGRFDRLTNWSHVDEFPSCTPDSRAAIFQSQSGGQTYLWRVNFDGSGPVQISNFEALGPAISPDGKWIACITEEQYPKLMVLNAGTGALAKTFAFPSEGRLQNKFLHWSPDGLNVLYSWRESGISNLRMQALAGGPPRQVTNFQSGLVWNFDFSRDGQRVALARGADTTDVVLIRNFLRK